MDKAVETAAKALDEFIAACAERGLLPRWKHLVRHVYSTNIARFEPDELGDTANSLGSQCAENLKVRAVRRFRCEDSEDPEDHWDVPGLTVGTPRNSLTFHLDDARVTVMKVAYSEGREPDWDRLVNWDYNSQLRQDLAAANSRALNYRTYASADVPMFDHDSLPGIVRNFMLVWAGEAHDGRTAGWLAVPSEGEVPFIARRKIWWDDDPTTGVSAPTKSSSGPSFDERTGAMPQVAVKPKPGVEGQS